MTVDENYLTPQNDPNLETEQSGVSRRRFLATGALAAASLALPRTARADATPGGVLNGAVQPADFSGISTYCSNTVTIPKAGTPFREPALAPGSLTGNPQFILDARILSVDASNAGIKTKPLQLRSFNCSILGPTMVAIPDFRDGNPHTIVVTLRNFFPNNLDDCVPPSNRPGCFNITNLHFHGLHVSPSSDPDSLLASDNVLIEIEPGNGQPYCVKLPTFHAPGTHWYHPHRHRSTAIQVEGGMLGAIIVPEPNETLNMVPADRDKVWVLQEIIDGDVYKSGSLSNSGVFLVNGLYQPEIRIQPQQWQRWRFINGTGTPRGLMNLKLVKCTLDPNTGACIIPGQTKVGTRCTFPPQNPTKDPQCNIDPECMVPLYLIAVDGISFYGYKPQSQGTKGRNLSPGNRADFLIWVEEPGTYCVVKDFLTCPGNGASIRSVQILATVVVEGPAGSDPNPSTTIIPGELPSYLQPIRQEELQNGNGEVRKRNIAFAIPQVKKFEINNTQYSPTSCNAGDPNAANCVQVDINTAELWTLQNNGTVGKSKRKGSAHPFHIHVSPFQLVGDLIDPDYPNDSRNWRWWDTIAVGPGNCRPIVQRFTDYPGEFVLHCHILIHEDQGMMMNVKVNGEGTGACETLQRSSYDPGDSPIVTCDYVREQLAGQPLCLANKDMNCSRGGQGDLMESDC